MTALLLLLPCFPMLSVATMNPSHPCAGLQEARPSSCCRMCLALYMTLQHEHADFSCLPPVVSCAFCTQHHLLWCLRGLRPLMSHS